VNNFGLLIINIYAVRRELHLYLVNYCKFSDWKFNLQSNVFTIILLLQSAAASEFWHDIIRPSWKRCNESDRDGCFHPARPIPCTLVFVPVYWDSSNFSIIISQSDLSGLMVDFTNDSQFIYSC